MRFRRLWKINVKEFFENIYGEHLNFFYLTHRAVGGYPLDIDVVDLVDHPHDEEHGSDGNRSPADHRLEAGVQGHRDGYHDDEYHVQRAHLQSGRAPLWLLWYKQRKQVNYLNVFSKTSGG